MIDHVKLGVSDLEKAKEFYGKALAPLGYALDFEAEGMAYFADATSLDFGVGASDRPGGSHVGFTAPDSAGVRAFYEAALASGGTRGKRSAIERQARFHGPCDFLELSHTVHEVNVLQCSLS